MNFFNFKEEQRNKKTNQRMILVMFFVAVVVQAIVSTQKAGNEVTKIEIDDTPAIVLMANNA